MMYCYDLYSVVFLFESNAFALKTAGFSQFFEIYSFALTGKPIDANLIYYTIYCYIVNSKILYIVFKYKKITLDKRLLILFKIYGKIVKNIYGG